VVLPLAFFALSAASLADAVQRLAENMQSLSLKRQLVAAGGNGFGLFLRLRRRLHSSDARSYLRRVEIAGGSDLV
jgi:DNA primase